MKHFKRSLICGLSAVLACGVLALAGCGDDPGDGNGEGAGSEVTAAQWAAAFSEANFTNFTYSSRAKQSSDMPEKPSQSLIAEIDVKIDTLTRRVYFTNTLTLVPSPAGPFLYEFYYTMEEDVPYMYSYDSTAQAWVKSEDPDDNYTAEVRQLLPVFALFEKYDEFTYSNGEYVSEIEVIQSGDENTAAGHVKKRVITFKNGLPATISTETDVYINGEYFQTNRTTITFSDYGTTVVELPAVE